MTKLLSFAHTQLQVRLIDVASDKILFDTFPLATDRVFTDVALTLGTRQFRMQMAPTAAYLEIHRGWQSWGVLVAGLASLAMRWPKSTPEPQACPLHPGMVLAQ